ncbi:MAG: (d)CMP kinase [Anaerolineae bacterium]
MKPSRIAIDGPAASGKSTIGHLLARRLSYLYFDTGVMYRAVTLAALRRGVPIDDEAAVTALAERVRIDVLRPTVDDGRQYTVLLDGEDVTWDLRTPEVDAHVSPVSAYPGVRQALLEQQRRIAANGRVVMTGRDIGTVVLPDAELKIYLDASAEVRARRRWLELRERGQDIPFEDVLASMQRRDQIDSGRAVAPLKAAPDAVVIDSTNMSIQDVVRHILDLIGCADGDE